MTLIAPLCALCVMASPAIALAEKPSAPTASIDITDLDLASERDAKRLESRIRVQINRMCAVSDKTGEAKRLERACRKTALANAMPKARFAIQAARMSTIRLAQETGSSSLQSTAPQSIAPAKALDSTQGSEG